MTPFSIGIDIGIRTFSFCIIDNIKPKYIGTCDFVTRDDIFNELNDFLSMLVDKYNLGYFVIEHQLTTSFNYKIQVFIEAFCTIRNIPYKIKKPITHRLGLATRKQRKLWSVNKFEAHLRHNNIIIDYGPTSRPDVCDAANIILKDLGLLQI